MNKDDEQDIVRIKSDIKVSELELIDEIIEIQEKAIRMLQNDITWKLYVGEFATQIERFSQIALCETKIKAWKSIKQKVEFADMCLMFNEDIEKIKEK